MTTKQAKKPQARKKKKCPECKDLYLPVRSFQPCCNEFKCQMAYLAKDKEKKIAKGLKIAQKAERKDIRERKKKLQPRSYWIKKAQAAFNKYVRIRDEREPCISCGRHHDGQYHAGHYLTTGASPELRYHPFNCAKQCAPCNNHLSGNIVHYRPNLIKKIGENSVNWLEGPHQPQKWTVEDLQEIEQFYKEQIKLLSVS